MGSILGPDGAPATNGHANAKRLDVRKWVRGDKRKCDGAAFCAGMNSLLRDTFHSKGDRIALFEDTDKKRADGIGYLVTGHSIVLLFNHCPACGGKLNLPANRA